MGESWNEGFWGTRPGGTQKMLVLRNPISTPEDGLSPVYSPSSQAISRSMSSLFSSTKLLALQKTQKLFVDLSDFSFPAQIESRSHPRWLSET
jgi:hypothetical protein